jgi:predicted nucleotidyltransferase
VRTVSLYADRVAPETRPTEDVDIVVKIATRLEYAKLEGQLRKIGFENDTNASFVGRFLLQGIILDVMPIDETILGFSSRWYKEGFDRAIEYNIDDRHRVKIFSAPYFMASKLEAFNDRGNNDGRTSEDFEDIVFILENRSVIWNEMKASDENARDYLLGQFKKLYKNPYIEEWIDSHSNYFSPPSSYFILEEIKNFIG